MYDRGVEPAFPGDVTAFILAGGKSSRMGVDKAFLEFDGRTLLARALELARSVAVDVHIVGSRKKFAAFAPVVEDVFPGHGPLGDRTALQKAIAMMTTVRDRVAALKTSGKSLADVQAAKPTAEFDGEWADRKSTRLNSSHRSLSRMPSSA